MFAHKLEVPQIILMSGDAIPGKSFAEQYASLLEGCKRAGDRDERTKRCSHTLLLLKTAVFGRRGPAGNDRSLAQIAGAAPRRS